MSGVRQFLHGFRQGLKQFGYNINVIVNSVLLSIVYIFGVGVTAVFARLVGKRFLDVQLSRSRNSYWSDLDLKKRPIEDYYRQF